jgi:hypothetical protein
MSTFARAASKSQFFSNAIRFASLSLTSVSETVFVPSALAWMGFIPSIAKKRAVMASRQQFLKLNLIIIANPGFRRTLPLRVHSPALSGSLPYKFFLRPMVPARD